MRASYEIRARLSAPRGPKRTFDVQIAEKVRRRNRGATGDQYTVEELVSIGVSIRLVLQGRLIDAVYLRACLNTNGADWHF
jgi:hypothetical protein